MLRNLVIFPVQLSVGYSVVRLVIPFSSVPNKSYPTMAVDSSWLAVKCQSVEKSSE